MAEQDIPTGQTETDAPPSLSQVAAGQGEAAPHEEAEAPTEPSGQELPEAELGETEPDSEASGDPEVAFSWQASEYVHHHKSILWYATVVLVVLVLCGIAAWLRLWLEVGVFLVMGAAVFVYASKPPRTLLYELSGEGVHIDDKLYPFSELRSFSVIEDPEWHSIDLEPAKRFSPRVVLLFDPKHYDEIIGHLERHLPREDRELDFIEKFTRKVRF